MTKDEELAKHMALIEQYKEQLSQLETQYSYVQSAINEYTKARMTVEQLSKAEDGSDILLPIGGSTFIDATAKKTSNVLFDVGTGIVLEKPADDQAAQQIFLHRLRNNCIKHFYCSLPAPYSP